MVRAIYTIIDIIVRFVGNKYSDTLERPAHVVSCVESDYVYWCGVNIETHSLGCAPVLLVAAHISSPSSPAEKKGGG